MAVIDAHTITGSGFWRRLTLLPSTDPSLLQTQIILVVVGIAERQIFSCQ